MVRAKTALTEALLRHDAPARASKDGSTSHLDVDPEEVRRNFTVATHITFAEHEGTLLNLLDAPGFSDFLTDADRSMAVCEGGPAAGLGRLRCQASDGSALGDGGRPRPAASGLRQQARQDRASFLRALDDIEKTLKAKPIALQLPNRPGRELQRDHRPDHDAGRTFLHPEVGRKVRWIRARGRAGAAAGGGQAAAHAAGGGGGGNGRCRCSKLTSTAPSRVRSLIDGIAHAVLGRAASCPCWRARPAGNRRGRRGLRGWSATAPPERAPGDKGKIPGAARPPQRATRRAPHPAGVPQHRRPFVGRLTACRVFSLRQARGR